MWAGFWTKKGSKYMKKRLLSILLSFTLSISLVACGSTKNVTSEEQVQTEEAKSKFEIEGAS